MSFYLSMIIKAQEKLNNISISGGIGLSNKSYYDIIIPHLIKSKNGLSSLFKIEYGREIKQLEISLSISHNKYSDIFKIETDSFFIGDTTLFVGLKEKATTSLLYFQLAPELKCNFIINDRISCYTGFSFGINHIYREKYHVISDFRAIFNNIDTTYINPNLSHFNKIVMSGKLFFGLSYKLSDNFSVCTDINYESFFGKIIKPELPPAFLVRLYNYGLNAGVKYHF